MSGRLVLVVGPSGAGKDSLLASARAALADDPAYVFPRRYITRPADAGGEDHIAVSPVEFERLRAAGAFALDWEAHGLSYAIPAAVAIDVAQGRVAVTNVSRTVVAAARERFAGRVRVVVVSASPAILARRLALRGREAEADIRARLERDPAVALDGDDVSVVRNDGPLAEAADRFVAALSGPR